MESLFDHIEVEDDAAEEELQNVPKAPPPTKIPDEEQSSHSQPPLPGSAAFPKSTAPSRYV